MMKFDNYIGTSTPSIIQFENANEGRSYPFEDNVTLLAKNGSCLPDNIITDLHLVIPLGATAFLSSVYISSKLISACVKVLSDQSQPTAMSVIIKTADFTPYTPYRLEKLVGSEDIGGIITFGDFNIEDAKGTYHFNDNTAVITESAISRYKPALVRSFIDDRTDKSVRSDVAIDFSAYIEATKTDNGVTLSLTDVGRDILMSSCDQDRKINICGATPVARINGVAADDKNRIVLWFH